MPYQTNGKRDYRKQYDNYDGKPEQIKNRTKRNSARSEMEKDGRVSKGDGKEVGHKKALIKGGSNAKTNLKVQSKSSNRSVARTSSNKMKGNG